MKSIWDIDKGYQPPFDRLCEQVEQQQKMIQELNDRLDALEEEHRENSNSMATAIKTELMLSGSIDRIKKDVESLKEIQDTPMKVFDWLLIFVVVSFVVSVMIIPAIKILVK